MSRIFMRDEAQELAEKYKIEIKAIQDKIALGEREMFFPSEFHIHLSLPEKDGLQEINVPLPYFEPADQRKIDGLFQSFKLNPYLISAIRNFLRKTQNHKYILEMEQIFD